MTFSLLWYIVFLCLFTTTSVFSEDSYIENSDLIKRDTPIERYICVEERTFPYAMVLMLIFLTIFLLGLIKGVIGLICSRRIGMFGLNLLLDLPHPINHYYEPQLRSETVVYDSEGWPVHPVTHKRVRIINESSELCLNTVFFFAFPFFVLWVAIQNACQCYESNCDETFSGYHLIPHRKSSCSKSGSPCSCKHATEKTHLTTLKSCPNISKEKYNYLNGKLKNKPKLDTYKDENDTTEEKDTKYVLEQLTKSEDGLNECKLDVPCNETCRKTKK